MSSENTLKDSGNVLIINHLAFMSELLGYTWTFSGLLNIRSLRSFLCGIEVFNGNM